MATHNDHPSYVKHVLGSIYVFFTLFGGWVLKADSLRGGLALGAKGATTTFWLSASNIGRGWGGGCRALLLWCTAVLIHRLEGGGGQAFLRASWPAIFLQPFSTRHAEFYSTTQLLTQTRHIATGGKWPNVQHSIAGLREHLIRPNSQNTELIARGQAPFEKFRYSGTHTHRERERERE